MPSPVAARCHPRWPPPGDEGPGGGGGTRGKGEPRGEGGDGGCRRRASRHLQDGVGMHRCVWGGDGGDVSRVKGEAVHHGITPWSLAGQPSWYVACTPCYNPLRMLQSMAAPSTCP